MNKERLLKLADLLEADADNTKGVSFDLCAWAQKKNEKGMFVTYGFQPGEIVAVNCDTAACAWGLAAISGAFKDEGVDYKIGCETGFNRLIPTFEGQIEFRAAESFFDIGMTEVSFLFDPDYYPSSKLRGAKGERFVAQRIRDLVDGKFSYREMRNAGDEIE